MSRRVLAVWLVGLSAVAALPRAGRAEEGAVAATPSPRPRPRPFDLNELRVEGAELLGQAEVERAVYPFLGPGRTAEDVDAARAALEKVYFERGYQAVAVAIPPQKVKNGVVTLRVTEGKIGKLRVVGARWSSAARIEASAPSMAEGAVPNFKAITRDIVSLNQLADRRVTPALRAGAVPGTVDVDLTVEDRLPLHGTVEVNDRHGRDTTPIRTSATVRYDDLWQRGHSLSVTYQAAPSRPDDTQVWSASYLARLPEVPWLSLMAYGVKQDSDVSTVGSTNVVGRGEIAGLRAIATLPGGGTFFHSLTAGADYKRFQEELGSDAEQPVSYPITYWPITVQYGASWVNGATRTELGLGATLNVRQASSSARRFDDKRYNARGNFHYLRGDLARTQALPAGWSLRGKVSGQLSNQPLLGSEQFSAGGAETVRGYLESVAVGDSGGVATVEVRTPSLAGLWGKRGVTELTLHVFTDGGYLAVNDPGVEEHERQELCSAGAGMQLRLWDRVSGTVEVGVPLMADAGRATRRYEPRVGFRTVAEF